MEHIAVLTREDDVSLWISTLAWLWFCLLLLPTVGVTFLFVFAPALAHDNCRFTLGDAVGVVMFCGSFVAAILTGFRTASFLGGRMSRSAALRRVWAWVVGTGASLMGGLVAVSMLGGLWTVVFWIISRLSFFHTGCDTEPLP